MKQVSTAPTIGAEFDLDIGGMTCASCAARVETASQPSRRRDGDRELRDRAGQSATRPAG